MVNTLPVTPWPLFTYSNFLLSFPPRKAHSLRFSSTLRSSFSHTPRATALKSLHAFAGITTATLVFPDHRASAHQFLGEHPKSYFKHGGAETLLRWQNAKQMGSPDLRTSGIRGLDWTSFLCPLWISRTQSARTLRSRSDTPSRTHSARRPWQEEAEQCTQQEPFRLQQPQRFWTY